MKILQSLVLTAGTLLLSASALAEKTIPPGAPAGSCCTNDGCKSAKNPNGEGSSSWSSGANAWSCKCDSAAVSAGRGAINPNATYDQLLSLAGNPRLDPRGRPLSNGRAMANPGGAAAFDNPVPTIPAPTGPGEPPKPVP